VGTIRRQIHSLILRGGKNYIRRSKTGATYTLNAIVSPTNGEFLKHYFSGDVL